jgi:uncharacterized OsmC-like protein
MAASLTYHVTAARVDDSHARITARGHELTLNIKKGSGEAGFNAAETLLAGLGACILTNVNAIGEKIRLQIDAARMEFEAARREVVHWFLRRQSKRRAWLARLAGHRKVV